MTSPKMNATAVVAHQEPIEKACFLPNGRQILSRAYNGETKLWDLAEPDPAGAARLSCGQAFDSNNEYSHGMCVTADAKLAILFGSNWTQIWNLPFGGWYADLTDQKEQFLTLAKRETLMITDASRKHGGLRVWDLKRGRPIKTLTVPLERISPSYHPAMEDMTEDEIAAHTPTALITNVTLIGDDKLSVSTENYRTFLFDLDSLELVKELGYRVTSVHSDGRTVFSAGSSGDLTAHDLLDDTVAAVRMDDALEGRGIGEIACLADGRVVTTNHMSFRIWRPGDWTCVRTVADAHSVPPDTNPAHARIHRLVVLEDGLHFATTNPYEPPKVWNPNDGTNVTMALKTDPEPSFDAGALRRHPLGLIGEVSGRVYLWDVRSGDILWSTPASFRLLDVAEDGGIACAHQDQLVFFTPVKAE